MNIKNTTSGLKYLLCFSVISLTSCSTILVQSEHTQHTRHCTPFFRPPGFATATYGGTILDVYFIATTTRRLSKENLSGKNAAIDNVALIFAAIDLPFSFVLDTVLIPISIPRDVIYLVKCGI